MLKIYPDHCTNYLYSPYIKLLHLGLPLLRNCMSCFSRNWTQELKILMDKLVVAPNFHGPNHATGSG